MGNGSSRSGGSSQGRYVATDVSEADINRGTSGTPRPLLRYHSVRGEHVNLNQDKTIASRRYTYFCKGLAFSDRPIEVDEIVCIRVAETSSQWSGVLRFGLTNVDPASFRDLELPKFACPDLTQKPGYWAKALSEKYCVEGSVLHFYVNRQGTVYYGLNGINKGVFLTDVDLTKPLWVLVDIYGNTVGIEFVGNIDTAVRAVAAALASENSSCEDVPASISRIRESGPSPSAPARTQSTASTPPPRPPLPVGMENLPYSFHRKVGINVDRISNWEVARKDNEFDRGYCFLNRPMVLDEVIAVRIEATEPLFAGALGFGLTSCNPEHLQAIDLPVDADLLLERPEYWVVMKDVGVSPQMNDVLQFQLKSDGRVMFAKNESFPRPIMHMDVSIDLWMFFDIFGKTKSIKLCRPREHIFRRETSLNSQSSDDDSMSLWPVHRPGFAAARLSDISFSPVSDSSFLSGLNNAQNTARGVAEAESVEAIIAASRRNRERLLEDASNTINRVRQESSAEPESMTPRRAAMLTTQEVLQRTEDFLDSLNNRSPSSRMFSRGPHSVTTPNLLNDPSAQLASLGVSSNSTPSLRNQHSYSPSTQGSGANDVSHVTQRSSHSRSPAPPSFTAPSRPLPPAKPSSLVNPSSPAIPPRSTEAARSARGNSQSRSNDVECSICLSESANAVIIRCGHVCTCMSCAQALMTRNENCPICRQSIENIYQVFFS